MNFVADEDVDGPIVEHLRQAGYQVWYVAEMASGTTDDVVLAIAREQEALLLTADKGFGEMVFRQQLLTTGVVLVRLEGLTPVRKAMIVVQAMDDHGQELSGNFSVISPGTLRIRKIR